MSPSYTLRNMTRQELDFSLELAAREGWNPGLHDADCFYAADPRGFWVGVLEGEAIATISAVKYGANFGFLGLYIVKPEFRGQGYGKQLWNTALAYLEGRTIGLDGVIEQQPNYKKCGFALAHRNIRYQGIGCGIKAPHQDIVNLTTWSFDDVKRYDRLFFPADRDAFLTTWIHQPQSVALGIPCNHRLCAYGVLRTCHNGYKIGPLCADTLLLADKLFEALCVSIPEGAPVYLDIPEANPAALELVARHNLHKVFETARMYQGLAPQLPLAQIFGITTFELG
jgi:GNAT superfamily N-acetyltransferase